MAGYVMSDLLARFRRANPEVEVTAIEDSGEYLEHLLIGGELDAAVMVTGTLRARAALMVEIMEVSPFRLWLPAGHPWGRRTRWRWRTSRPSRSSCSWRTRWRRRRATCCRALSPRPRVAFRTRSVEAVRSLVATGAGVALLPDLI
jgi:DNA-binding transcriptional LysR family regulator